jgi:hypothetical protein
LADIEDEIDSESEQDDPVEVGENDSQNGHEDLGFTFLPIGEFLREFHR